MLKQLPLSILFLIIFTLVCLAQTSSPNPSPSPSPSPISSPTQTPLTIISAPAQTSTEAKTQKDSNTSTVVPIAISIISLAVSVSGFGLSLTTYLREKKRKFLDKQTEILSKSTSAKMLLMDMSIALSLQQKDLSSIEEELIPKSYRGGVKAIRDRNKKLQENVEKMKRDIDELAERVLRYPKNTDILVVEFDLRIVTNIITGADSFIKQLISAREDLEKVRSQLQNSARSDTSKDVD